MAHYWVVFGGTQIGLPSNDVDEAKQLRRDHLAARPSVKGFIEVYDGAKPMATISWDSAKSKWLTPT